MASALHLLIGGVLALAQPAPHTTTCAVPAVKVRGHVSGGVPGMRSPEAVLYAPGLTYDSGIVDGTFGFVCVTPGSYYLAAAAMAGTVLLEADRSTIVVGDKDVDGLLIVLRPALEIRGTVRWSEESHRTTMPPGLKLILISRDQDATHLVPGRVPHAMIADDGSFSSPSGGARNKYRIVLERLPEDCYVKSARMGTQHALAGLDLTGGVTGALDLVISTKVLR